MSQRTAPAQQPSNPETTVNDTTSDRHRLANDRDIRTAPPRGGAIPCYGRKAVQPFERMFVKLGTPLPQARVMARIKAPIRARLVKKLPSIGTV